MDIKKLFLYILLLSALLFDSKAATIEQCQQQNQTSVVYLRCLDTQLAKTNQQRILWENNLIFILEETIELNGRSGALRLFKKSIQSYHRHAENYCRWQYQLLLPDPTSSAITYKQCLIKMGNNKIIELKASAKTWSNPS